MRNKLEGKQEEEKQLLRYFKSSYAAFPSGRIRKSESPDFIVQTGRHHRIGIELTKLYLHKAADQLHFIPENDPIYSQLILLIKQKIWTLHPYYLSAHFDFRMGIELANMDLLSMAEEIATIISERLKYWDQNNIFHTKIKAKYLPGYLKSITLIHHPDDKVLKWISCKMNVPPENFLDSIQLAIHHKNKKLDMYRKDRLDEYWLLIEAECLNCASPFKLDDLIERWEFKSAFNRIFLFELFEQKIHDLKL